MIKKKTRRLETGNIGSALIMTVVLTVLLAIVAVMFVLIARMDSAATSNIADNKMLDSSVKSIIEIISKDLLLDTPGVLPGQEYYDYPDVNNAWLASLEPYQSGSNYYWRQISDVTGFLHEKGYPTTNVNTDAPGAAKVIREYPDIKLNADGSIQLNYVCADADGDGIADSKWFELTDLRTSKGKPIYAAVRVIDNSGMINVDTAYRFDADSSDANRVDGSSQMQVNLKGLLKGTPAEIENQINDLHNARCGTASQSWSDYGNNVIWQYGLPTGNYLPFDISDELELRYRYCIDSKFVSRFEEKLPYTAEGAGDRNFGNLYDGTDSSDQNNPCFSNWRLPDWQRRITEPNDCKADRRHLLTTLNLDRIIDPAGSRMFNILSDANAQELYQRLKDGIDANYSSVAEGVLHAYLAQFAANVIDRSDDDANVTVVVDRGNKFYGMERPYIYISEIVRNFAAGPIPGSDPPIATVHRSYAIELYKEFEADEVFQPWLLRITGIKDDSGSPSFRDISIYPGYFNDRGGRFYVIVFESQEEPNANLSNAVKYSDSPDNGATGVDPEVVLRWERFFLGYDPNDGKPIYSNSYDVYFGTTSPGTFQGNQAGTTFNPGTLSNGTTYFWRVDGSNGANYRKGPVRSFTTWNTEPNDVNEYIRYGKFIFDGNVAAIDLYRPVDGIPSPGILVDRIALNDPNLRGWFFEESDPNYWGVKSFQRDMWPQNRIKRIWDKKGEIYSYPFDVNTLGGLNAYYNWPAGTSPIQPWYYRFRNVGDAAMVFVKSTYLEGNPLYRIQPYDTEPNVRFDINDPAMQNVFKYITVWRPDGPNETRIKGRLNINTAPAFVIRQLPWLSSVNRIDVNIADAIVAYRDKLNLSSAGGPDYSNRLDPCGFRNIGRLLNVADTSPGKEKYSIRYCGIDNRQQYGYPDLTFDRLSMTDNIPDDLEEEELIFARISDLVTVRSDIFTAYILVRIGTDGPQKRVITILDRSGVGFDPNGVLNDKVKIRAFQLTPEAR